LFGHFQAFSPPVLGCLVKKGLQKGGHGHPKTPPGDALLDHLQFSENLTCGANVSQQGLFGFQNSKGKYFCSKFTQNFVYSLQSFSIESPKLMRQQKMTAK